jgi:hypothetical protein
MLAVCRAGSKVTEVLEQQAGPEPSAKDDGISSSQITVEARRCNKRAPSVRPRVGVFGVIAMLCQLANAFRAADYLSRTATGPT